MALPVIDCPVFETTLPLSQKRIRFRPFRVKEQKNLLMALEADDKETIERNIKQILHNCTLTPNVDIDNLPIVDVEYYFINLRAKSVGEVVENTYICNNDPDGDGNKCGNRMKVYIDLSDITIDNLEDGADIIKITPNISLKMKYPEFSTIEKISEGGNAIETAFNVITNSIEYIFDGDQYYYAEESTPEELSEFIESLNQDQFSKLERFFESLPKIRKDLNIKCDKCGFDHSIVVEGLENFFG